MTLCLNTMSDVTLTMLYVRIGKKYCEKNQFMSSHIMTFESDENSDKHSLMDIMDR